MTQTLQVAVKNNGTVVTSGTNTSIAALSDGGHVVTWTVRALTSEVRQQRYTATGAPNGAESQVSASPANDQVQSVVTGLKNGGWVVTWLAGDGSSYGLYSQAFGANGAKVGAQQQVSSVTLGNQSGQSVTALDGGGFVVTWTVLTQGAIGNSFARIFGADGQPKGPDIQVGTAESFGSPDVTQLAGGGFVVTWADFGGSNIHDIFAQVYNADGSKNGGQLQINPTDGWLSDPSVAALAGGGFVVSWDSGSDIYQRVFNVINDAPTGIDKTLTLSSNTQTHTFSAADFGFTDANNHSASAIIFTTLPDNGTLTFNGQNVGVGMVINANFIHQVVYTPATSGTSGTRELGHFTFQIVDNGGTLSGGKNTDATPNTITINQLFNDTPAGTNNTFTLREESPKTFSAADFGFVDSDGGSLKAVIIVTLTATGSLTLDGVKVLAGQSIAAADIGKLIWTPTAASVAAGTDAFTFKLQDNGGTPNGSKDTDASPNTIGLTVNFVHNSPWSQDKTLEIQEDTSYTFKVSDFAFSDPGDPFDPDTFTGIKVSPLWGDLKLNGVDVEEGQFIAVADINKLVYTAAADDYGQYGLYMAYLVVDDGDTSNGGANIGNDPGDLSRIRIDVVSLDDAPTGTDARLTVNEDTAYAFSAATFGFSDPKDFPAQAFTKVIIKKINGNGDLKLDGKIVVAGQTIAVDKLNTLTFTGDKDGFGSNYASIEFAVVDGGSNTGGHKNTSLGNTPTFDLLDVVDTITGTSMADSLKGTAGVEIITAGAGNDILNGGGGGDRLDGGTGNNTASYAGASKGVTASLTSPSINTNDAKGDVYISIENLTGSSYADLLAGNSGANLLIGGLGNDTLRGEAGDDTLNGGVGADRLEGGTGIDTASYAGASTGVRASLITPSINTNDAKGDIYISIENLTGSSYADSLTGNAGINVLAGGSGNDTLFGGAGGDRLDGGSGTDTASYAGATTAVTASLTKPSINTADAKGDTYVSIENLTGTNYADNLTGNTGANVLTGGSGN
ncbi:MAG: beta strand repeat-containing protein, partial [Shinella sp.]|uniref:beta strand repeat-containing protein n=1 Tax=Shinella sp. TaxID=1870904 RepID=UPI0040351254